MRSWNRIYSYPKDYAEYVHKYYVDSGVAYLATYYSVSLPDSIYDGTQLDSGSYELVGSRSGMKWNKFSLIPIYFVEQIQPMFTADERGFGKFDQISSFVLPPSFELTPCVHDFIIFIRPELDETEPVKLYEVTNFEKSTNTPKAFWKVKIEIAKYKQVNLDLQIQDQYIFVEHEKKNFLYNDGLFIYKLLEKNTQLALNSKFNSNSGFYLGT